MNLKEMKFNFILLFVIILLNEMKMPKEYKLKSLNLNNEIIITINGTQRQQILSGNQNIIPSEIIVNNQYKTTISYNKYINNLVDEINNITIKWNEPLSNCESLFWGLKNILSIDLSNFDSSKLITMNRMFFDCFNLISLDLSKLNTSSVIDMNYMFSGCRSLESLDLSKLDTSSVKSMNSMFDNCDKL